MKLLIVNPILFTFEKYAIPEIRTIKETMIYSFCLGFIANGHQVTLAAATDYKPVPEETDYDFEVLFFKSTLRRLFRPALLPVSFDFFKYLKGNHHKYDLIVSSEVFSFFTLFTALVCPSKTVIWQEMCYHQRFFKKAPSLLWHRIIVPLFMRKVQCVIPRSEKARLFIRRYMKNVTPGYVDHGINISRFRFSTTKKRQLISSSRLIYRKNVESIIEKYSRLIRIKGYEDVRLLIVGWGEYKRVLDERVKQLNLQDNVAFLGFLNQKELNDRIKESYAFLIDTRQDLNMVSIPEAIVSGTPVVTNLVPASADYIRKEKLGIAKDGWDASDLVEIIENNTFYVDNCINYRDKLTNTCCAKKIIEYKNVMANLHPPRHPR